MASLSRTDEADERSYTSQPRPRQKKWAASELTEKKPPLDEEVAGLASTSDEMRHAVQALYMNMAKSVAELNVAVAVLRYRVGASRPPLAAPNATVGAHDGALAGALGGDAIGVGGDAIGVGALGGGALADALGDGGPGVYGGRSKTPSFAGEPPDPDSPVSVDRLLY
jgi:hypothetical protein